MYYVVVTVPTPEDAFPDLFQTELHSGVSYDHRSDAQNEYYEALNDSRFIYAWIEFRCDDQCEKCEFYDFGSDLCKLVYSEKGIFRSK